MQKRSGCPSMIRLMEIPKWSLVKNFSQNFKSLHTSEGRGILLESGFLWKSEQRRWRKWQEIGITKAVWFDYPINDSSSKLEANEVESMLMIWLTYALILFPWSWTKNALVLIAHPRAVWISATETLLDSLLRARKSQRGMESLAEMGRASADESRRSLLHKRCHVVWCKTSSD